MLNQNIRKPLNSMPGSWRTAPSLAGYFVAVLACLPIAFAASNSVIWEKGDEIVQLVRQDDDSASPNSHPIDSTAGEIKAMLKTLRLRYVGEEPDAAPVSVFTQDELDNLGSAIATGLSRATPSQDVIFHVIGVRRLSRGAFARRNRVSAGRVFYRDGKFHIIFGQVQTAHRKKNVYGQTSEDFYPRNYGSRNKATKHDVVLLADNAVSLYQNSGGTRDDWIVIDPAAAATASSSPAAGRPDAKPEPTPLPASSAAPVALAEAPATASSPAAGTGSNTAMEQAGGASSESAGLAPDVEERLESLKKLRDRDLISEEAYQAKMKEILQDL